VAFVQGPKTRSDTWVLIGLPDGQRRLIPKAWTSLATADPYEVLPERPLLRPEALQELADWISGNEVRRKGDQGGSTKEGRV